MWISPSPFTKWEGTCVYAWRWCVCTCDNHAKCSVFLARTRVFWSKARFCELCIWNWTTNKITVPWENDVQWSKRCVNDNIRKLPRRPCIEIIADDYDNYNDVSLVAPVCWSCCSTCWKKNGDKKVAIETGWYRCFWFLRHEGNGILLSIVNQRLLWTTMNSICVRYGRRWDLK